MIQVQKKKRYIKFFKKKAYAGLSGTLRPIIFKRRAWFVQPYPLQASRLFFPKIIAAFFVVILCFGA